MGVLFYLDNVITFVVTMKTKYLQIRITPESKKRLKREAKELKMKLTAYINFKLGI